MRHQLLWPLQVCAAVGWPHPRTDTAVGCPPIFDRYTATSERSLKAQQRFWCPRDSPERSDLPMRQKLHPTVRAVTYGADH